MTDGTRWVLVAGAYQDLSPEQRNVATAVGRMLGRGGYGLIVGCWPGVDYLVTRAFRDAVGADYLDKLRQIDTDGGPADAKRHAKVSSPLLNPKSPDGNDDYSEEAVELADAGIVVPGCELSKPAMDALVRKDKPVLPIAHLGTDAFQVFIAMLQDWNNLPIRKLLTRRQFLELAMPSTDAAPVERLLFAVLQTEPVIFVSYRHTDVPDSAARIAELLVHRYGRRSVFIDVDGIRPGKVFSREIRDAVQKSRAMVPIIGPRWEGPADVDGVLRIAQRDDWVARELVLAHNKGAAVFPVLVQRPSLDAADLPPRLRWLTPVQQTQGGYEDLEHDLERLLEALDSIVLPRHGH